jgi:hypothetical protein
VEQRTGTPDILKYFHSGDFAWLMNGPSVLQAAGFGTITADWIMQSSK